MRMGLCPRPIVKGSSNFKVDFVERVMEEQDWPNAADGHAHHDGVSPMVIERGIAVLSSLLEESSAEVGGLRRLEAMPVPCIPTPARPSHKRNTHNVSIRQKKIATIGPSVVPQWSRLHHTRNLLTEGNPHFQGCTPTNNPLRDNSLLIRSEMVTRRLQSTKPSAPELPAPHPVYVPPKHAARSINMANLRYVRQKKKRPRPPADVAPIPTKQIMSKTPCERIGQYYSQTFLSPRTLCALDRIVGNKARKKLLTKLLSSVQDDVRENMNIVLTTAEHRAVLVSLYDVEDILWQRYPMRISIGDVVIHLPTGTVCTVKSIRESHRNFVLSPVPSGKDSKLDSCGFLNHVNRVDAMPVVDKVGNVFREIRASILDLRTARLELRRMEKFDHWLINYLDCTGQLCSYPFTHITVAEIVELGVTAMRQSHALYRRAKLERNSTRVGTKTNCLHHGSFCFEYGKRSILENHLYTLPGVVDMVLAATATLSNSTTVFLHEIKDALPCNAKRFHSRSVSMLNSAVARLDKHWRRKVIADVTAILQEVAPFDLAIEDEDLYRRSLAYRLVRRIELQMSNELGACVQRWIEEWSEDVCMKEGKVPYFHLSVHVDPKTLRVSTEPSLRHVELALMHIPRVCSVIQSQITTLKGSVFAYLGFDERPLHDPFRDSLVTNLAHKRILATWNYAKASIEHVIKTYTYDSGVLGAPYEQMAEMIQRIQYGFTSTFTDAIVHFDVANAKNGLLTAIINSRELRLEGETVEIEKNIRNALVELEAAQQLVNRCPENASQWQEQTLFRRNRHQFVRRFNVKVIQVSLSKISALSSMFLKLPRDINSSLHTVQTASVKIFEDSRDSAATLLTTCKKFTANLRHEQKFFMERLVLIRSSLDEFEVYNDMEQSWQYVDTLEKISTTIQTSLEERKRLLRIQHLLEIDVVESDTFPQLDIMEANLKTMSTLWTVADEWNIGNDTWVHGEFDQVDVAEMSMKLIEWAPKLVYLLEDPTQLKSRPRPRSVANRIRLLIHAFKKHVPAIIMLRHPGMRQRHWSQLGFRPETFQQVIEKHLDSELILRVHNVAKEEYAVEMELDAMRKSYKTRPVFDLAVLHTMHDPLYAMIGRLREILLSPFSRPHEIGILEWLNELQDLEEYLVMWESANDKWNRLKFLLHVETFEKLCLRGHSMLDKISVSMPGLLSKVQEMPVIAASTPDNMASITAMNESLMMVEGMALVYVELKREESPRLYLLPNDVVLEVLKENIEPMRGIFGNGTISCCRLDGMIGHNGQMLSFIKPVQATVGFVETAMRSAVASALHVLYAATKKTKQLDILQTVLSTVLAKTAYDMYWTSNVESAFSLKDSSRVLAALKKYHANILEIIQEWRPKSIMEGTVAKSDLFLIYVSARDDTEYMIKQQVRSKEDFLWVAHPRVYYQGLSRVTTVVMGQTLTHDNEFIGDKSQIVLSPKTLKCIRSIMFCALAASKGGTFAPPSFYGQPRENLVRECANSMGKLFIPIYCSPSTSTEVLADVMKAIITVGAWCILIDPDKLGYNSACLITSLLSRVRTAYADKLEHISVGTSKESSFGKPVFFQISAHRKKCGLCDEGYLPLNVSTPNFSVVAELLMTSYGFQHPGILAPKMVACLSAHQLESQVTKVIGHAMTLLKHAMETADCNDPALDEGAYIAAALRGYIPASAAFVIDYFGGSLMVHKVSHAKNIAYVEETRRVVTCLEETAAAGDRCMLVTGPTHCGKTEAIKNAAKDSTRIPIYTQSCTVSALWGGCADNEAMDTWSHGLLYHAMLKTIKTPGPSWLCFDGKFEATLTDALTSLLYGGGTRALQFGTFESLQLLENTEIVFETVSIDSAAPSFLTSCTVVHVHKSEFDANWYFSGKRKNKMFMKLVKDCSTKLLGPKCKCSDILQAVGAFEAITDSLLEVSASSLFTPSMLLYGAIWSFGEMAKLNGVSNEKIDLFFSRKREYYKIKLPPNFRIEDCYIDPTTTMFVPFHPASMGSSFRTKQSQLAHVVKLLVTRNTPVALVGHGANPVLDSICDSMHLVDISAFTTSCSFATSMMAHIDRERVGLFRPAYSGKPLLLCINDLNLCSPSNGYALEHLRQYSDFNGWWLPSYDWGHIKSMHWLVRCHEQGLDSRPIARCALLKNFEETLDGETINSFAAVIIRACISSGTAITEELNTLAQTIASVSAVLHRDVQKIIPSYMFQTGSIQRCFEGLSNAGSLNFANTTAILRVWRHDITQEYTNRISIPKDKRRFESIFAETVARHFNQSSDELFGGERWHFDPSSHVPLPWEEGISMSETWGVGANLNILFHETLVLDVLRVCRVIRTKRLCPLVLIGTDLQDMCEMVATATRLVGLIFEIVDHPSCILSSQNKSNVITVVRQSSWSALSSPVCLDGPSTFDAILHYFRKSHTRVVILINAADTAAVEAWTKCTEDRCSIIVAARPPQSYITKALSRNGLSIASDADAVPAFMSLFQQVSSVWQNTFGISCVERQVRCAVDFFYRSIDDLRTELTGIISRNRAIEVKLSLLEKLEEHTKRKIHDNVVKCDRRTRKIEHFISVLRDAECDLQVLKTKQKETQDEKLSLEQKSISLEAREGVERKTSREILSKLSLFVDNGEIILSKEASTAFFGKLKNGKKNPDSKPILKCLKLVFNDVAPKSVWGKLVKFRKMESRLPDMSANNIDSTKAILEKFSSSNPISMCIAAWILAMVTSVETYLSHSEQRRAFDERQVLLTTTEEVLADEVLRQQNIVQESAQNLHRERLEVTQENEWLQQNSERLKCLTLLQERMAPIAQRWNEDAEKAQERLRTLVADVVRTTSFVKFCGPLSIKRRNSCWEEWGYRLKGMGFEVSDSAERLEILERVLPALPAHILGTNYDHMRENSLILLSCETPTVTVVDPHKTFAVWWTNAFIQTPDDKRKRVVFDSHLPETSNLAWCDGAVVSIDACYTKYYREICLHAIAKTCHGQHYLTRYSRLNDDNALFHKLQDELQLAIFECFETQDGEKMPSLASAMGVYQRFSAVEKEKSHAVFRMEHAIGETFEDLKRIRKDHDALGQYCAHIYTGLSAITAINPLYRIGISEYLRVVSELVKHYDGPTNQLIDAVTIEIGKFLMEIMWEEHWMAGFIALWLQRRRWESPMCKEDDAEWNHLLQPMYSSSDSMATPKMRSMEKDLLPAEHVLSWCDISVWRRVTILSETVPAFALLPSSLNETKHDNQNTWKQWHGRHIEYFDNIDQTPLVLGKLIWKLPLPPIKMFTPSPIRKLILLQCFFPSIMAHVCHAWMLEDVVFTEIFKAMEAGQRIPRSEKLVQFLTKPGEANCGHQTLILLGKTSVDLLGHILQSKMKAGLSLEGNRGLHILPTNKPIVPNELVSIATGGGWIVVPRPDLASAEWCHELVRFIAYIEAGSIRPHPRFRLILWINNESGLGNVPKTLVAKLQRLAVNPITSLSGNIVEHFTGDDWSTLPEEMRASKFIMAYMLATIQRQSQIALKDSNYAYWWDLTNHDEAVNGALAAAASKTGKQRDMSQLYTTLKAITCHVVSIGILPDYMYAKLMSIMEHVCKAMPFSGSACAIRQTPLKSTVARNSLSVLDFVCALSKLSFVEAGLEGWSRPFVEAAAAELWKTWSSVMHSVIQRQIFNLENKALAEVGKTRRKFGERLLRLLSVISNAHKTLHASEIKASMSIVETVLVKDELRALRVAVVRVKSQLESCKQQFGIQGHDAFKADKIAARSVYFSLRRNEIPAEWAKLFNAVMPIDWVQSLAKRVRYFSAYASSGAPLKQNVAMFSTPQNCFFVLKYSLARQLMLPLEDVCLISEAVYKRIKGPAKHAKFAFDGCLCRGACISHDGSMKILDKMQTGIEQTVPTFFIYCVSRQSCSSLKKTSLVPLYARHQNIVVDVESRGDIQGNYITTVQFLTDSGAGARGVELFCNKGY